MTTLERLKFPTPRQTEVMEHILQKRQGKRKRLEEGDRQLWHETLGGGARLPSPAVVIEWAIRGVRAVERLLPEPLGDVPFTGPSDSEPSFPVPIPHPLRLQERLIMEAMETLLAKEGPVRFLDSLRTLGPYLDELERVAREEYKRMVREDLPRIGVPYLLPWKPVDEQVEGELPGTMEERDMSSPEAAADLDLYSCLRGRNRGEGPARTVGEYRLRAKGEGYAWNTALDVLKGFKEMGLVERFVLPPSYDTPLRLASHEDATDGVGKPPMIWPWDLKSREREETRDL